MDFYTLSDKGIEEELGLRLKSMRLRKNITQKELADRTTLSLNTIKAIELGRGKLSSLIAVLRELSALEQLEYFIPEITISPMQIAKMQGKVRQRATGDRVKPQDEDQVADTAQSQSTGESEW